MSIVSPQTTKIGWIGCGVMGLQMCRHIINAGYRATVYNRTQSKCDELKLAGANVASSPRYVAQDSDVVFLMVGLPSDVEDAVWGKNGVLGGLKKGSVLIDMTTSRPSLAERIGVAVKEVGATSLDAPVSGGDVGARNASLSIMVGGETTSFDRVHPLLACMGKKIIHMGATGTGQHTKMANQILIATNMIGVCEALMYAHSAKLDVELVLKAVSEGAAGSWSLSNLAPRMVARNFEPGFYVDHFVKDMEIALDVAREAHLSLPGLALAHQLYIALKAQGHGRKGTQALLLALETLNSIERK